MKKEKQVSVPIRGLFNLTMAYTVVTILKNQLYKFPSPSGDYLI